MTKDYEEKYSGFIHPASRVNWSPEDQMKAMLSPVEFGRASTPGSGGIPIISDGKTGYVDASDAHCSIFGSSGSKKSICAFMPLICTLIDANENFLATDPKGELFKRTAKYAKKRGYKVRVLNFRDFNGEGYNPLSYPAKLYKEGNVDKASAVSSDFVAALAQKQLENSKCDPFWPETAKAYNNGVLPLMFSSYPSTDEINFISLSDYYTSVTADRLEQFLNHMHTANAATQNLRTVLSEPERTRMSTLSTCSSFIQAFIQNDKLARMLSRSTFDLEELADEKTALYIITDDTSPTCDPIVGVLISQIQSILIDKAYHSENCKLKTRMNFVLDEFCSFPIPKMESALATHRSRNIRYYLCIQSIDLLGKLYPNYKNMLTNCGSAIFLGSTEPELLEMISNRCGKTDITLSGREEPLISVPELMTLKQDWYSKEAIYMNLASGIRYCATLPAIERYDAFSGCGEAKFPDAKHPKVRYYPFVDLVRDISDGKMRMPFSNTAKADKKPV